MERKTINNNLRRVYVIRKLFRYILILFIIITANFLVPRLMPGDPVTNLLGEGFEAATPEEVSVLMSRYGLDRPLSVQYFHYLFNIIRLDFGYSIILEAPVWSLLSEAIKYTLILVFPAVILSGFLSLILGTLAGFTRNSRFDSIITSLILLLYTIPSFFLAMIVVSIFSYHLGWFPLGQLSSGDTSGFAFFLDVLHHLTLPVIVLTLLGTLSKYMVVRSSTTHILDDYFIFVLRAKGFSGHEIVTKHIIKNILPQFISMMALSLGFMVSGSLLVEIVFSIDGMGELIYQAVVNRDYPILQGAFLVITFIVLIANLTADILYAVSDPRIGDSQGSGYQL